MAVFLVRIELHKVNETDSLDTYISLHESMKALGFSKTITSGGVEYELPSAEYLIERDNSFRIEIAELAERAARSTGYDHSLLVTEVADWNHIFPYRLKISE